MATVPELAASTPAVGRTTIVTRDLHVIYRVYEDRKTRVRDVFAGRSRSRPYREIHAVKGLSITAGAGEMIGVVGPNGSGKSTLMTALAGLLPATSGAVYASSQPVILGVSAVLRSALSGRRNIMIGGLALGMTRREVEAKFDEIVAFAGLEEFIDLPMKAYSSGMKARLHFAISTAVSPEILLIDEALAVGDQQFKEKCLARIRELRSRAGTVFLVTHNHQEVRTSCTRAIWMEHGVIQADGKPDEVVDLYEAHHRRRDGRV